MTEEEAIAKCEKRAGFTVQEAMDLLKEHAPNVHNYFLDSSDNMDGWEDNYEGFYAVLFDQALYFKHGGGE